MKKYSQKTEPWASEKIGKTKLSVRNYGCLLVCISCFDGRNPSEVNKILTKNNCYNSAGEILHYPASKALGLKFSGLSSKPKGICIAETKHYENQGFPQHFYIYLTNGLIFDPLDGMEYPEKKYKAVSYRLYQPKEAAWQTGKEEKEKTTGSVKSEPITNLKPKAEPSGAKSTSVSAGNVSTTDASSTPKTLGGALKRSNLIKLGGEVMEFLNGKKTKIAAILTGIWLALSGFGIISEEVFKLGISVLVPLDLWMAREAISKAEK